MPVNENKIQNHAPLGQVASAFVESYGELATTGRVYSLFVEVFSDANPASTGVVGLALLSDHARFHSGALLGYSASVHAGRATRRS